MAGRTGGGYIAATQWHPEFHRVGSTISTVDDTAILDDFLNACRATRTEPTRPHRLMPGKIRDRAARMLRQALLRR